MEDGVNPAYDLRLQCRTKRTLGLVQVSTHTGELVSLSKVLRHWPLLASQSRLHVSNPRTHLDPRFTHINPSALLVMQIPPLASHPTHHTASLCAGSCLIDRPLLTSQMMALSSMLPVTSMFEVGENATERIGAVWPS